jgi:hypothetical protein
MPKNAVKQEAAEPYSEKTSLGGPIFKVGSYGTMPCRVQLSSKILTAANLKPRDQVQVISEAGQIIIRKIGDPRQGYSIPSSKPRPELDKFLEDMKKRSNPPEWDGEADEGEDEAGLSDEQLGKEEL